MFTHCRNGHNITQSPEDFHKRAKGQIDTWTNCLNLDVPFRSCMYSGHHDLENLLHLQTNMWATYAMDQIRPGLYFFYIAEWLKVFPRNQVLVIKLEEYSLNKLPILNEIILPFLGLNPYDGKHDLNYLQERRTNSKTVSFSMFKETREMLTRFYEPYNKLLSKFLSHQSL